jgi:hypothetical protein
MGFIAPEATLPPQFAGRIASAVGMLTGTLAPRLFRRMPPPHRAHLINRAKRGVARRLEPISLTAASNNA